MSNWGWVQFVHIGVNVNTDGVILHLAGGSGKAIYKVVSMDSNVYISVSYRGRGEGEYPP